MEDNLSLSKQEVKSYAKEFLSGIRQLSTDSLLAYIEKFNETKIINDFSLLNCFLIYIQKPGASIVAGYKQWEKIGRFVKKSERAIGIYFPQVVAEDKKEDDIDVYFLLKFRLFDVKQTDGKPYCIQYPAHPRIIDLYERKSYVMSEYPLLSIVEIFNVNGDGGCFTEFREGHIPQYLIKISLNNSLDEKLVKLFHETTHFLIHKKIQVETDNISRAEMEFEAYCVSHIIAGMVGINEKDTMYRFKNRGYNLDKVGCKNFKRIQFAIAEISRLFNIDPKRIICPN